VTSCTSTYSGSKSWGPPPDISRLRLFDCELCGRQIAYSGNKLPHTRSSLIRRRDDHRPYETPVTTTTYRRSVASPHRLQPARTTVANTRSYASPYLLSKYILNAQRLWQVGLMRVCGGESLRPPTVIPLPPRSGSATVAATLGHFQSPA
jgi:hypothetical protein